MVAPATVARDNGAVDGGGFDRPEVVAAYAPRQELTPAEAPLFDRRIPAGSSILDLGVGAGRTTAWLVERAGAGGSYVGTDVAPRMIEAARRAHPSVDLRVGDAADLGAFEDRCFDVVVFSYNGLDYLAPDEARHRCLREVHRVLRPGGTFVFSTHDPRALLARRSGPGARPVAVAVAGTVRRLRERALSAAVRRGEGWVFDRAGAGFHTHMAVPSFVRAETEAHGFTVLEVVPGDGGDGGRWSTSWWYYVAERT